MGDDPRLTKRSFATHDITPSGPTTVRLPDVLQETRREEANTTAHELIAAFYRELGFQPVGRRREGVIVAVDLVSNKKPSISDQLRRAQSIVEINSILLFAEVMAVRKKTRRQWTRIASARITELLKPEDRS